MKFQYITENPGEARTDLLAVTVLGDARDTLFKSLDRQLGGRLTALIKEEAFKGSAGQALVCDTRDALKATRVVLLGAGPKKDLTARATQDLAATAARTGRKVGAQDVLFVLPGTNKTGRTTYFAAMGAALSGYSFAKYKAKDKDNGKGKPKLARFRIASTSAVKPKTLKSVKAKLKRAEVVARGVCRARDLVNEPAGFLTPTEMAKQARSLAKKVGLQCKILGRAECAKLGMGMFLAVGQGSDQEPKLIHLTYKPKGKAKKKVALIGKGVMFDSGGYSLKPSAAMEDMKIDMAGSAAVISAMGALAELGCDHEVHGIAACCENLVSGGAFKLGDVLKAMDGTTVEINNTDAEGRLTLGDAITYARAKVKPDEIFDFATLTGACMVALGPYTAGVLSKDDGLAKRWLSAADHAGETMWRLPLQERLKEQLKSNIADMRNTGERWGGAITAGLFLSHFAKDSTWLHVDLAGPASTSSEQPSVPRGGTGFGVATIVEYLQS